MRLLTAATAADEQVEVVVPHRPVDLAAVAGDDLGVDAGLGERVLDGRRAVEELLLRDHADRRVEAILVAGLGQKLTGALDVQLVSGSSSAPKAFVLTGR